MVISSKGKRRIALKLKSARCNLGFSQAYIAKKLGYSTAQYVSNYERGLCLPANKNIRKICKILKIEPKILYELYIEEISSSLKLYLGKDIHIKE